MPFDTLEEIIEAIDRNPQLRKQIRDKILGDEFLELPAQVAALTASVNELAITLNEFMVVTNKRFDEIDKRLNEHDKRFDSIDERLNEHDKRFDSIDERLNEHDKRFDSIDERLNEHDERFDRVDGQIARVYDKLNAEFGQAKGRDFENKILERAFLIPDVVKPSDSMELEHVRNLRPSELRALADAAANTANIPRGHLESFYFADLVIEAVDSANATCYITAEISYTCDEGDTERALRNAGFLERFTGKRSYAVVVGVSLDERIHSIIESGTVHWYELEEDLVISR
jgi:archaellum component FlaC